MERRFATRLDRLRADAVVPVGLVDDLLPRLERFLDPFTRRLQRSEQIHHARASVAGLLSDLEDKNVEAIAYLHDQDRMPLPKFIGQAPWDHAPLLAELARQVGQALGHPDGVIVFDPSAFPKKGTASVGVQRPWCGRLGKVDNGQVGVYLASAGAQEHALVDVRLYLPRAWARDRKRWRQAGVPKGVRFRTRHELALAMLDERGPDLPHGWVSGDAAMGRAGWFRRALAERGERYLLAVPANTLVRDLHAEPPPYAGRGRRPAVPFRRLAGWWARLPEAAWTRLEVRAGAKGPLVVEAAMAPVRAKTDGKRAGPEAVLVVFRERQADGTVKHDAYLSNAPAGTPRAEFARVAKAAHRVEECLQRAKGEAGLADYEVRTWAGWHHHQTLSLLATWFLTEEAGRGKKGDARGDRAAGAAAHGRRAPAAAGV